MATKRFKRTGPILLIGGNAIRYDSHHKVLESAAIRADGTIDDDDWSEIQEWGYDTPAMKDVRTALVSLRPERQAELRQRVDRRWAKVDAKRAMKPIEIADDDEMGYLGLWLGYPPCCAVGFMATYTALDYSRAGVTPKLDGTGYVPCPKCNENRTVEELTAYINRHRLCFAPFPKEPPTMPRLVHPEVRASILARRNRRTELDIEQGLNVGAA